MTPQDDLSEDDTEAQEGIELPAFPQETHTMFDVRYDQYALLEKQTRIVVPISKLSALVVKRCALEFGVGKIIETEDEVDLDGYLWNAWCPEVLESEDCHTDKRSN